MITQGLWKNIYMKKEKVSKLQMIWKITITISLLLNLLGFWGAVQAKFAQLPAVKRYATRLALKGFLSQWNFQWLIK